MLNALVGKHNGRFRRVRIVPGTPEWDEYEAKGYKSLFEYQLPALKKIAKSLKIEGGENWTADDYRAALN